MQRIEQLQQLIEWLAGTDIGLLDLRTPTGSIRLGRTGGSNAIEELGSDATMAPSETTVVGASTVGVFLQAHPMHTSALASVGDPVSTGQTLGLLQIGPLLQPVTAPLAGVVAELRVDSGRAVGWGEPLIDLHASE
ncbi:MULTISPECIES: biotin/lipoyl-containing protein [unclassified Variovorax]|uniref:acetyl-CoA carboxylase biotin carboxyl carrier protein n=1 Tax=unclassified Variovorax TaxID=663243 RepID=UPI001BD1C035|nr:MULTISPECIES: biotin/lipoyl-containing protein [unclassified Variovorax]